MKDLKTDSNNLYICEICGKKYKRFCDLSKHIGLKSPSHHQQAQNIQIYKEIKEAFENGYRQGSTKLAVKENAQEHSDVMKQNNFLLSEDMDEQIN